MMLQVSNDRATWHEVELDGDVVIPFVFAVDDIRENVKRASYSKTFTIKGTPRNVQLFAALYQTHAYDVESWSRVVCNRPLYARLYGDAVLVYEGMLMITQARYTQGAVEFDCSLVRHANGTVVYVAIEATVVTTDEGTNVFGAQDAFRRRYRGHGTQCLCSRADR
ncbi:MAG: hypothetical protein KatS3mg038_2142 [Candidatus Kapaibacterium sp.]|nr:MAG: hypothetical protein KatS3mg038_2142 [Candidatus Kapabacteria bacterium]